MSKNDLTWNDTFRSCAAITTFLLIFLIATPIILLLLICSLGNLTNFIIQIIAPLMMRPVLAVAGITFKIHRHRPRFNRPAVYIINHCSTIDIVTILALGLPRVRFVAKWELQYNPIFFLLGRLTGQVFIKRKKSERAVQTLHKAYNRIKNKRLSVLLAPEGSRKHPGVIGPFKKGPFRMAMDLEYPIIPVYFEGSRQVSEGGAMLGKPGPITAHIHPPVDTSNWSLETLEEHIRGVRHKYLHWAGVQDDPIQTEIKNSRET